MQVPSPSLTFFWKGNLKNSLIAGLVGWMSIKPWLGCVLHGDTKYLGTAVPNIYWGCQKKNMHILRDVNFGQCCSRSSSP